MELKVVKLPLGLYYGPFFSENEAACFLKRVTKDFVTEPFVNPPEIRNLQTPESFYRKFGPKKFRVLDPYIILNGRGCVGPFHNLTITRSYMRYVKSTRFYCLGYAKLKFDADPPLRNMRDMSSSDLYNIFGDENVLPKV